MERKERGWETNGESEDGGSEADDIDEGETSLHAREDGQKKKGQWVGRREREDRRKRGRGEDASQIRFATLELRETHPASKEGHTSPIPRRTYKLSSSSLPAMLSFSLERPRPTAFSRPAPSNPSDSRA